MKNVYEKGLRKAVIREGEYFIKGKYSVDYYYNGELDYEAIQGNVGVPCKTFDTFKQAQNNARYYIKK